MANRVAVAVGILLVVVGCQDKAPPTIAPSASATAVAATSAPLPTATAAATARATSLPTPSATGRPAKIIAQHVLVTYRGAKRAPKGVVRSKAEAKARAEEVVTKLKGGEDFAALVKTYSEDEGSVDRQGSVGKFAPGDMDPAFSAAAFALSVSPQPGSDSAPVETPFGFHVIRRTQ